MAVPPSPVVVLTREPADNRPLAEALRARGVPVREIPCTGTRYREPGRLPGLISAIVFTSRRGVIGLWRSKAARHWWSGLDRVLVAAVGPATRAELEALGVEVDLVADPPRGEVLADALQKRLAVGDSVALVRGDLRAGELDQALERAGLVIEPVEVYQNQTPVVPGLDPFPVSAVFAAAPSAAERLLAANPWMSGCAFLAIGATTAAALSRMGVASVDLAGRAAEDWVEALCTGHRRALRNLEVGERSEGA